MKCSVCKGKDFVIFPTSGGEVFVEYDEDGNFSIYDTVGREEPSWENGSIATCRKCNYSYIISATSNTVKVLTKPKQGHAKQSKGKLSNLKKLSKLSSQLYPLQKQNTPSMSAPGPSILCGSFHTKLGTCETTVECLMNYFGSKQFKASTDKVDSLTKLAILNKSTEILLSSIPSHKKTTKAKGFTIVVVITPKCVVPGISLCSKKDKFNHPTGLFHAIKNSISIYRHYYKVEEGRISPFEIEVMSLFCSSKEGKEEAQNVTSKYSSTLNLGQDYTTEEVMKLLFGLSTKDINDMIVTTSINGDPLPLW